jgi:hypothetical protein
MEINWIIREAIGKEAQSNHNHLVIWKQRVRSIQAGNPTKMQFTNQSQLSTEHKAYISPHKQSKKDSSYTHSLIVNYHEYKEM